VGIQVFVIEPADTPIGGVLGVHADVPEITGTHEQRHGLQIQIVDGARFPVACQERLPAHSGRFLKTAAPQKDGQVISPVAVATAVEIEEGQGAVLGNVGVVTLQIAVAATLFELTGGQRQDPLAQGVGKPFDEGPIIGATGQKGRDVTQRLVDKVLDILVEARVRTVKVIQGIRRSPGRGPR
jgi:hypothetical protein